MTVIGEELSRSQEQLVQGPRGRKELVWLQPRWGGRCVLPMQLRVVVPGDVYKGYATTSCRKSAGREEADADSHPA